MPVAIVTFYAGINALIALVLAAYVVVQRGKTQTDEIGGHPSLHQAQRAHANLIEFVPIILILLLLLALGGVATLWLHVLGVALTVARLLHAWGLLTSPGRSIGRFAGASLTFVTMLVAIILALRIGLAAL